MCAVLGPSIICNFAWRLTAAQHTQTHCIQKLPFSRKKTEMELLLLCIHVELHFIAPTTGPSKLIESYKKISHAPCDWNFNLKF